MSTPPSSYSTSVEECADWISLLPRYCSLILWCLVTISILSVLCLTLRIFRMYHVYFMIFYNTMVFTRIGTASIRVTGYALVLLKQDVPIYVNDALWVAKFVTGAATLACMMERGYATYYAIVYESSNKQSLLIFCSILCVVTGLIAYYEGGSEMGRKIFSVGYSLTVTFAATFLTLLNRRLVVKSQLKCHLSERYQLTENIKALRLLNPFVTVISINSIVESIVLILFDADSVFHPKRCNQTDYLIVFYSLLFQTTLMNIATAMYVLIKNRHVFMKNKEKNISDIKNILGVRIIDVNIVHDECYFKHYNSQWA